MNWQSEVVIEGDHAIGEIYCLAHEFWAENNQRKFQTLGIRYYDEFLHQEDRWYFVERKLLFDWSDTRNSVPSKPSNLKPAAKSRVDVPETPLSEPKATLSSQPEALYSDDVTCPRLERINVTPSRGALETSQQDAYSHRSRICSRNKEMYAAIRLIAIQPSYRVPDFR